MCYTYYRSRMTPCCSQQQQQSQQLIYVLCADLIPITRHPLTRIHTPTYTFTYTQTYTDCIIKFIAILLKCQNFN